MENLYTATRDTGVCSIGVFEELETDVSTDQPPAGGIPVSGPDGQTCSASGAFASRISKSRPDDFTGYLCGCMPAVSSTPMMQREHDQRTRGPRGLPGWGLVQT